MQEEETRFFGRNRVSVEKGALPLLLIIVGLGAFLRFYHIGRLGLWLDEAFSVWMARQPAGDMLRWVVRIDQHPPLYYLLLHLWMAVLGDGEAAVRGLSALCGTLTIPVIYLLGRRLDGKAVGLLAALILAISPFHVRFAQEARMYALLALNASLALYMLVRLLTDPRAAEAPLGRQVVDGWRALRGRAQPRGRPEQARASNLNPPHPAPSSPGHEGRPEQAQASNLNPPHPAPSSPGHEGRPEQARASNLNLPARRWCAGLRAVETDLAWLGYVVFTAATVWTHNTAVLLPAATNLFVIGTHLVKVSNLRVSGFKFQVSSCSNLKLETLKPETFFCRNWLMAQAALLILWLPWLPALVSQGLGVYRDFWLPAPTWGTVAGTVGSFASAFLPWPPVGLWAAAVLFAVLAVQGALHLRHRPARLALLLVTFATPFAGELLVSLVRPVFHDKTLIWASIPLYLLLAAGVCRLGGRPRAPRVERTQRRPVLVAPVVLMILAVNGASLREYYTHFEKEAWDRAAAIVAQRATPDDLILFNATWTQIPFDYYYRRLYNRPVAEHGAPVDLFDRGVLEPKMAPSDLPRLRALIQGHERVWLIYSHDWYTDPQRLIPQALEQELDLWEQWEFRDLQVRLYGSRRH